MLASIWRFSPQLTAVREPLGTSAARSGEITPIIGGAHLHAARPGGISELVDGDP